MPRLRLDERRQMVKLVREGFSKKAVAKAFGVSRQTVWKWCKQAHLGVRNVFSLERRFGESHELLPDPAKNTT